MPSHGQLSDCSPLFIIHFGLFLVRSNVIDMPFLVTKVKAPKSTVSSRAHARAIARKVPDSTAAASSSGRARATPRKVAKSTISSRARARATARNVPKSTVSSRARARVNARKVAESTAAASSSGRIRATARQVSKSTAAAASSGRARVNTRKVHFVSNGTKRPAGPLTRRRGSALPRAEANRVVVAGSCSSRHTGMHQTRSEIVRRAAELEQY